MLVDRKDAPAELQAAKKEVQEAYAAYQRSLQRYHGLTTGFSQQPFTSRRAQAATGS
jgi:hypothetical protein